MNIRSITAFIEITIKSSEERIRPDKSEVQRLLCNNEKILATTEWKPRYNLETGLLETINWLKGRLNLYKTDLYNV